MAVDVRTQNGIETGEPRVFLILPANAKLWDIASDRQRVLLGAADQNTSPPLSIVTNWTANLPR
ncbi:MAG: hypothetical protein ACRD3M_15575 [Thermoanaerobaculia bacterium]